MSPSLLIVNDEANLVVLLERILSREGYQFTAVHGFSYWRGPLCFLPQKKLQQAERRSRCRMFGSSLLYLTGSQTHWVLVRDLTACTDGNAKCPLIITRTANDCSSVLDKFENN
jgi:CheY-like chemotaxis protein